MEKFILRDSEEKSIKALVKTIAAQYCSAEDSTFLHEAAILAHDLPRRLRAYLNDFKANEPASSICLITGYEIDQSKIGETPPHWRRSGDFNRSNEEEIYLTLMSSLLGDVFGWATQQDGKIIHDVLPIRDHINEQIGTGSEQEITWHNEDAFHPCRGDYVALMCLRNTDKVPTTVAAIDLLKLEEDLKAILFEPRFIIRPDYSHYKALNSLQQSGDEKYERIDKMMNEPEKLPVLFGDRNAAYIRIDPFFMDTPGDREARKALEALISMIDDILIEIILNPGEICFIDNYKAVHGRKAFKARFDGADRWLKRLNITRDLRKSRGLRGGQQSRIIC
jgi:Fe(II)/alpha-ketoglutarate-dependent arginine beta-hydroxylase